MVRLLSGGRFSGVPQGSVLGPTLFLIFINDLDITAEITGAMVKKFADDTKGYMVVECETWSAEWQMLFNVDKCHVIQALSSVWVWVWGDKELLEKVQRKAVMMVTKIRGSYEERLAILKMSYNITLESYNITLVSYNITLVSYNITLVSYNITLVSWVSYDITLI
jgi:hypothetical protein